MRRQQDPKAAIAPVQHDTVARNDEVRAFWEAEPCGTNPVIVGERQTYTREWFEQIEEHRYSIEPFIHSVAQFTRHRGKKVLEIGVGAGTDHLQWARAGAECYGVDLTDAAIETTRRHLSLYGFTSDLQRVDAERLPFESDTFQLVYSWGVIHHAANPERMIAEIRRVLRPGGKFIGMMYGRRSPTAFRIWIKQALLRGRPWRSLADVVGNHMESVGTKAYTVRELVELWSGFRNVAVEPVITSYDLAHVPACVGRFFPDRWGWFITIRAEK